MSIMEAIRSYYSLFGPYGVLLGAKARLLKRPIEVAVAVPSIRHPVHLRLRTTDVAAFRQVFAIAEYDCEFARRPRVIFDAGANIGTTTIFYAHKYPEARIVAIEPESSNYEMLKKNTALYANVTAVHGALWKENKQLVLRDPGLGHYGFQTGDEGGPASREGRERVQGLTVDKLMADCGIDYIDVLKVDIEGAEKEVFEDPSAWIDRVGVIVIELHDRLKSGCSRSLYRVATDFEFEWRKGETIFLLRKEYVACNVRSQATSTTPPDGGSDLHATKLRFRILRES